MWKIPLVCAALTDAVGLNAQEGTTNQVNFYSGKIYRSGYDLESIPGLFEYHYHEKYSDRLSLGLERKSPENYADDVSDIFKRTARDWIISRDVVQMHK